ncbi:MAG TPA: hypothetical protein VK430_08950 [Xanthobacteraceae bacterium]|nr:hypothetical protein [Xanthobacteraceae bacterium]
MCRPKTEQTLRALAAAAALGALLGACSDLYYDRRESIALSAGDAVAANAITQTVDPWPAHSGNVNIAANGQKMQSAVERYRTNKVTPPPDPMGLDMPNQQPTTTLTLSSGASSATAPSPAAGASSQ